LLQTSTMPNQENLNINFDPSRIAAQIVTGIGFIGGGALLREGTAIRGVTTAASLWNMAAIGMLVGAGLYSVALFATVLSVVILYTMGKLHYVKMLKRFRNKDIMTVTIYVKESHENAVLSFVENQMEERTRSIETTRITSDTEEPVSCITYVFDIRNAITNWTKWKQRLRHIKGVQRVLLRFNDDTDDV
jgi:putative Mg2+ transporter-C (MgtC) family protein